MEDDGKNFVSSFHDSMNDNRSSVELNHTTKGTTWRIKVYDEDPRRALEIAKELFEDCRQKYDVTGGVDQK